MKRNVGNVGNIDNINTKKKIPVWILLIALSAVAAGIFLIILAVVHNKNKSVSKAPEKEEVKVELSAEEIFADMKYAKSFKKENAANALYTQRFGADPGVMEYDGRIYIYMTNDVIEYDKSGVVKENTYGLIDKINCISSEDLVNWTDHGAMEAAGKSGTAKWASNSWAPCAAHKEVNGKEVFYLFFANGGNGICVLTSDTPVGPWKDPLGKPLITRDIPGCGDVVWLFDPAILIDDDGTGYLYFGGGIPDGEFASPGTARVVKLSDDLLSLDGEVKKTDIPYLFEDSGINKIDGKYYYSYCSNFNTDGNTIGLHGGAIQYMVSDNPMGPFEYAGEIFENPGKFFGAGGNNHHSIFEFGDGLYLAYHARTVEAAMKISGNYRSPHIDKLNFVNGKFEPLTGTYEGVKQTRSFNPYKKIQASTMSDNGGITVKGMGSEAYVEAEKGDWIKVSKVGFGESSRDITVSVKSNEKTYMKACVDSRENKKACYIEIPDTKGKYEDIRIKTDLFKNEKDLYFVFAGNVSFAYWRFDTDMIMAEEPQMALKDIYADKITLGMCLNPATIGEKYKEAVTKNFSSVTCENEMKADFVLKQSACKKNVEQDQAYVEVDFSACEGIVRYCEENGLKMRYHTLIWQNQTPDWFFYKDYDTGKELAGEEIMKKRMENYIRAVISWSDKNHPNLIYAIDVVNEAFNGNGKYKVQETKNRWYEIFGSSYVYYAFLYARQALDASDNMKNVTLVYNDYNMLYKEKIVDDGLKGIFGEFGADVHDFVDAIGFQGHIDTDTDVSKYTSVMKTYSDLGYEVQITELDIGIPKVKVGTKPSEEQYIKQGGYVKKLMTAIMALKDGGCNITSVTLWGINDANSWRSNVDGYNAYGLLWSEGMKPKPALRGFALCKDVD